MTPEQGKALCKIFTDTCRHEAETTKKVIRAVPDDKKSYKPDPKSMSAHELAWHITTAEIMFCDFILSGQPPAGRMPEAPATIGAILDWYETNHQDRIKKVDEMPGDKLAQASYYYFQRLKLFAIFTKHPGFKEENEWRVMYMRDRDTGKV